MSYADLPPTACVHAPKCYWGDVCHSRNKNDEAPACFRGELPTDAPEPRADPAQGELELF